MIREEALRIIKRLDAAFQFTQKLNEDYVRTEYINILKNLIVFDCNEAIDNMIMNNKKELPTPGEILEACKLIENDRKSKEKFIQPESTCYVCNGNGFIIHQKKVSISVNKKEKFVPIDLVLFCTECEKGKEFNYQGKNNEQRFNSKTDYYSEPITKYFDIEALKTQNLFKSHEIIAPPAYAKEALRNFTSKFGRAENEQSKKLGA